VESALTTERKYGLTDAELTEYSELRRKWREATLQGKGLSEDDQRRMDALDSRKVFQFSPCEKESPEVTEMVDTGFFITNPNEVGSAPPASMFFDATEAAEYQKQHADAKFWTVVDGDDGDEQFLEQGIRLVNRFAYLIENPSWKPVSRQSGGER